MRIDDGDLFSDAQAITATAKSTHSIDLRAPRFIAVGQPQLFLIVQTVVTATDASSDATLAVDIESDDNAGMATPTVRQSIAAAAFAAVSVQGHRFGGGAVPIFPNVCPAPDRYIQLGYTVTAGPFTAGAWTSWITADPQLWNAYPQGSTGPVFA